MSPANGNSARRVCQHRRCSQPDHSRIPRVARGVSGMCQRMSAGGGMWHGHGPAGAVPPTASQQWGRRTCLPCWPGTAACSGMGRVKVPGPKISSIRGAGTASRSIPLEASSRGGSMEHAGGRSAPGEAGDLRLASFRVTSCSRTTARGGSRPRRGRAANARHDRLAPVLRTAAAAYGQRRIAPGAEYQGTGWRARHWRLR
jgi:hypothetical protein